MNNEDKVCKRLREIFEFPDHVSNEVVLDLTKHSIAQASVRLNLATQELKQAFIDSSVTMKKSFEFLRNWRKKVKTTELNSNDLFQIKITGANENHLSWNDSFFRASKRYVAIIDGVPKESEDAYAKPGTWTPCEKLPF